MAGGLVIVQEPNSAEFPMMPQNIIDSGIVDFILPPIEIAKKLNKITSNYLSLDEDTQKIIGNIFKKLDDEFNINFNLYKISTILRRLERRLYLYNLNTIDEYYQLFKNSYKERKELCNDFLIIVTSFCRDKDAFLKLRETIKTYILNLPEKKLKIWNIGCGTGEETYSLSVLISDIIKTNKLETDFHIFSTDLSEKALETARIGQYSIKKIETSFPECHIKYFTKNDNNYKIIPEIREKISFAKHNILEDTPLINVDLIVCRNLLIYFTTPIQQKVLKKINYALKTDALLFLGKSESIPENFDGDFKVIDLKSKIFQKIDSKNRLLLTSLISSSNKKITIKTEELLNIIKSNLIKSFNSFIIIDKLGNILYTAGDYEKYLSFQKGFFQIIYSHLLMMI